MGERGPGLRRPAVVVAGRRDRRGVSGRLSDREEPVGRQHPRLRVHLLGAADPAPLPAARPHARDPRRPGHARRVHRRRSRAPGELPPGHLRLRRPAALRRDQDAARREPPPAPAQHRPARPAADPAGHGPAARPAFPGQGGRPGAGHPAAAGPDHDRDNRRDLRRGLDTRDPGRQHRHVRGLHLERVRAAGHAGAVLPAGRGHRPGPLPAAGAGRHPGRRGGEDAARRPLRVSRLGVAGVHRGRPGRHRRDVPA